MKKRKICVVVTARPSYSRVKTLLKAIKDNPNLELQLVVAASALLDLYGSVVKTMENDGFKINAKVFMIIEGENPATMAKTTGIGLIELSTVFYNIKPDIVVTIADRYETIATAIAAAYMNIPLAHIQGGEITGSIDEKVRHAITKLANFHFVSNSRAADNVIRMGEFPEHVFITGCPSIDLVKEMIGNINEGFDPFRKYTGVGSEVNLSEGYLVVMQHPVTTEYDLARVHITETLYAIKEIGLPALWFWPNVDAGSDGTSKGIRSFREIEKPENIYFFKNMEPKDFLFLLKKSKSIVGNSSVAIRECSYMGVPAVNIGTRQDKRERGSNVLDVDYDRGQIVEAIRKHLNKGHFTTSHIYGDGNAGSAIAEVLEKIELKIEKRLNY